MEKIFENPYLEMYSLADELPHTIFGYWKGYWELSDPVAMAALEFPFAYVRDHGIKVMITDYSYLEVVPEDTAGWIDEVWFPTVVKNGLLAEIVIDAAEIYGQLSVQFMYEHVSSPDWAAHAQGGQPGRRQETRQPVFGRTGQQIAQKYWADRWLRNSGNNRLI
jgi:hypothetical protein